MAKKKKKLRKQYKKGSSASFLKYSKISYKDEYYSKRFLEFSKKELKS